jgi:hypothetical protein
MPCSKTRRWPVHSCSRPHHCHHCGLCTSTILLSCRGTRGAFTVLSPTIKLCLCVWRVRCYSLLQHARLFFTPTLLPRQLYHLAVFCLCWNEGMGVMFWRELGRQTWSIYLTILNHLWSNERLGQVFCWEEGSRLVNAAKKAKLWTKGSW